MLFADENDFHRFGIRSLSLSSTRISRTRPFALRTFIVVTIFTEYFNGNERSEVPATLMVADYGIDRAKKAIVIPN